MKKQIAEEGIEFFDEIIERYNPKRQELTQEIFEKCKEKYLKDKNYDCADFRECLFYSVCLGLKKWYLEYEQWREFDRRNFEDELNDAYAFMRKAKPSVKLHYASSNIYIVLHGIKKRLRTLRYRTLDHNAYLREEDYDPNVDKIESDENEFFARERETAVLKEVNSLSPKERDAILSYYGFGGRGVKTIEEVAKEQNSTSDSTRNAIAYGARRLRHPMHAIKIYDYLEEDKFTKR